MTVKSRYGSYLRGRYFVQAQWNSVVSPSSARTEGFTDVTVFDYGQATGQYDLTSTTQFKHTPFVPPTYSLGFSPSLLTLSGQLDAWTQRTIDVSGYAGATVYLVFHYVNTANFTGDIQLDQIDLDGNIYSFENVTHNFQTSNADDQSIYANVSWTNLAVERDNRGAWQVDTGGTPSNSTGRTDAADGTYYVYAETSSPANSGNYDFWLRSPQVTLSQNPTLTFFEARFGAGIGQLDVHLDVIV